MRKLVVIRLSGGGLPLSKLILTNQRCSFLRMSIKKLFDNLRFSKFQNGQIITKKGFTMAEVLITLSIIGVVSAMTLPSLVNNTQNKILYTQLKKSYSVILNALQQMNYEQGYIAKPKAYEAQSFFKVFKKYLFVALDCNDNDCESKYEIQEDGSQKLTNISSNYKTFTNKKLNNGFLDDGQAILPDGSFILIQNENNGLNGIILISVDVNGFKKKPNRWGHDLFTFQILENGKLLPMGATGTLFGEEYCSTLSTDPTNGIGCTYKALTNDDYFKNLPK